MKEAMEALVKNINQTYSDEGGLNDNAYRYYQLILLAEIAHAVSEVAAQLARRLPARLGGSNETT
jgi:hypothetical protein